jgi:hypothetical protein
MAVPVKQTMLPGYNHNVTYKGITFHIQTEDSGINNPHIITLLYSGGNILARKKTSYADIIKHERLADVVRELMQDQHKHMLKELKNGVYDTHPLVKSEMEKRGIKPAPVPAPVAAPVAAPPPPPLPVIEPEVKEKPAQRTIDISDDKELSDTDIFGADIISNKSLDEVILSFLSQRIDEEEK